MHRNVRRSGAALATLAALAIATTTPAFAQETGVAPGSFAVHMAFGDDMGGAPEPMTGAISAHFRDGEVRLDLRVDEDQILLYLVRVGDEYVLKGVERMDDFVVEFEFTLGELLEDDDLYADFTEFYLLALSPESPLHPCRHTQPEDGVLTGDFSVWDCAIVGSEELDGRSTSVWELEHIWGREGQMAIFEDPIYTIWVDDELGVPLALRGGYDEFDMVFVRLDATAQDPGLFAPPE
jgi:hypothetical protein